ncbi:TPA: TIGR04197 family type VII secretion effector [Streptococcus equi subsp. zooepidemicus]|uniref:Type VII secretion effector n=1 Tax=Streptococcus equi subsp. zooepidemicus (strain MGCS10565) TaxID=552526 RepID=B4U3F6_STREM|nr:TIGR04197 family type VII secretion effector [Streptococcus equi]ACG62523.1 hypothetical protein Sez_1174 [Streptococcus equi subsp. zooepidemicus MGCS10565]MCD3387225.1 TIGR04197 family type VII secretion effector [Streptococcus equi subsp. zooepidemicus]MCD3418120.1 TIGR04197 family type VII secretion effector [Streptococcus equi subsp. zooepidemicus]MCD3418430.1 TIGR04197 family type VII secretion effector [Streptococcus equi subsp. zooepidemicus]MCD3418437.1 TIGR04197 family type VII se
MVVLQNNSSTASERATALARGVQSLSSAGAVSKDMKTTVVGNRSDASSAIDLSHNVSAQVVGIITSMSQHIQSVSASFQAMDLQLGKELGRLESKRRFSLNDPK